MDVQAVQVKDIMQKNVVRVRNDMKVAELADVLQRESISGVPVVDQQDKVIGVVTQTDVIRRDLPRMKKDCELHPYYDVLWAPNCLPWPVDDELFEDMGDRQVSEIMTKSLISTTEEMTVKELAQLMSVRKAHRVLILDEQQRLKGIVTTSDITKFVADYF